MPVRVVDPEMFWMFAASELLELRKRQSDGARSTCARITDAASSRLSERLKDCRRMLRERFRSNELAWGRSDALRLKIPSVFCMLRAGRDANVWRMLSRHMNPSLGLATMTDLSRMVLNCLHVQSIS